MGVIRTLGSSSLGRPDTMNHPLAGAHNHGGGPGVAAAYHLKAALEPSNTSSTSSKEGTSYAFSFVIVGNSLSCRENVIVIAYKPLTLAVVAVMLTCFSCWLRRLLSKRRTSKEAEDEESDEQGKKNKQRRVAEVVVNF